MSARTSFAPFKEGRWYSFIPVRLRAALAVIVLVMTVWLVPVWAITHREQGFAEDFLGFAQTWSDVFENALRVVIRGQKK